MCNPSENASLTPQIGQTFESDRGGNSFTLQVSLITTLHTGNPFGLIISSPSSTPFFFFSLTPQMSNPPCHNPLHENEIESENESKDGRNMQERKVHAGG